MKRLRLIATAVTVIILVTVDLVIFSLLGEHQEATNFEWGIDVGEVYEYTIESDAAYSGGSISESLTQDIVSLNGTIVKVTIISLPLLNSTYSAASFVTNIVRVSKVSCTLTNGTELGSDLEKLVSTIISSCFLPVGDWQVIDQFYADEIPVEFSPGKYYYGSQLFTDHLQFSYKWCGSMDDGGGWTGSVTLSNGVPSRASWGYSHSIAGAFIDFSLIE